MLSPMSKKTTAFDPSVLDFSSCVPKCEEKDLHPKLCELLRRAQHLAGFRFTFTSGFRPKAWEISKGRNGSSSHSKTPGLAVDISTIDSHTRYKVLVALACVGVPRLGVGKNFVHADIDVTKAHPIIFHYYD